MQTHSNINIVCMYAKSYVHVCEELGTCLPRVMYMYAKSYVHVCQKLCTCMPRGNYYTEVYSVDL